MATVADRQALNAALAQIDRAFGKDAPEVREGHIKVWMDPFTEERVMLYIEERVMDYLLDDEGGGSPFYNDFWYDIWQDIERGEHRIIPHPFDRMYPPVTIGERIDLFIRRVMGWFQRPALD